MTEPVWVLPESVRALHERLLSEFGGDSRVRDDGMIESALSRPRNQFLFGSPTMPELAAAYAFGLIRNHPFVDGNKRVGFTAAVLFLEINHHRFSASEIDATVQTLALAAHQLDEAGYATWIAKYSTPVRAASEKAGEES
jgi:death on curing protein